MSQRVPREYLLLSIITPSRGDPNELEEILHALQIGMEALGYSMSSEGSGAKVVRRVVVDGRPPRHPLWEQ